MFEPDAADGGYGAHRSQSRLHDWRVKASIQSVFSHLPRGDWLNYQLQRWVTRTLPVSDVELAAQVAKAQRNIEAYERHGPKEISAARLYEFGAGWDLLIPMVHYAMGVNEQLLIDLKPLARLDLVSDIAGRLRSGMGTLGLKRPPQLGLASTVSSLVSPIGVTYSAPRDARATMLPAGRFDFITSTDVMEHVPQEDVLPLLRECRRILAPGGVMRIRIDYQDHYWYFDSRVSPYNFLSYDDRAWRRFNPPLHFQNRIRHPEFLALIAQSGFAILEDEHPEPTDDDLQSIARRRIAPRYRHMPIEALAIRYANLTLASDPPRRADA